MQDVFLVCLLLGAGVLAVQIVLGFLGGHTDVGDMHIGDAHGGDGLDLLSVRTISAGATLFGAIGLWLAARGSPALLSLPIASFAGVAASVGTAYLTRQMLQLESDGTLHLENAVGQPGTIYLPVPPKMQGTGKVQFMIQGRTVEIGAVGNQADVLPTGTNVIVVSVVNTDTVEVVPTPLIEGIDV